MKPRAKERERGFALLLVFVMAAVVAISLYMEIPRVAFETQRNKEQLLVERGEEYKRAIKLYVNKFKRYPQDMDALEKSQNIRFLRKRFKDPLTGKDEWRLIHSNGMFLTDSLVEKPPDINAKNQGANGQGGQNSSFGGMSGGMTGGMSGGMSGGMMGGGTMMGSTMGQQTPTNQQPTDPNQPPQVAAAAQFRPSDRGVMPPPGAANPQAQEDPENPAPINPGQQHLQPGQFPYPGQTTPSGVPYPGQNQTMPSGVPYPGQNQTMPSGVPYPGQTLPGQAIPGQMVPGQVIPGQMGPNIPGQVIPGQPQQVIPGVPFPGQQVGPTIPGQVPVPGQPYPGQAYPGQIPVPGQVYPGAPNQNRAGNVPSYPPTQGNPFPQGNPTPFGQGPQNRPTTGANQATDLIRNILTNPRPGGLQGVGQQAGGSTPMGAGIAGVASKYEGATIRVYNERSKYQEWEFVFDPNKEAQKAMSAQMQGQQQGNLNQQGNNSNSSFGSNNPGSGFGGNNSSFGSGGNSGFGGSGSSFGGSGSSFGGSGSGSGFGSSGRQR